ncbi:MAG: LamG domain-containing protein, partial [Candidatus Poribacteria bacterium]
TCVGLWLLDEGKGDTAKDLSGNNYDGTLKNNPKWIDGKFGKALDFTGVDDHISIPKGCALLEQQFSQMTIVAWVNPVSFGGGTYGHTIITRTDTDGWAMRINNGQLLADLRLTGGNVTTAVSADKLILNVWSHIAITYDNSNGVITGYINGKNVGTLKGSGTIKNGANANTCTFIGTDPAGCTPQGAEFDFNGSIDEVAMFSMALTENDIKTIINSG